MKVILLSKQAPRLDNKQAVSPDNEQAQSIHRFDVVSQIG